MKVSRKEIGVGTVLGLAIALFSILYNVAPQTYSDYLGSHSAARSALDNSAEFLQRVRIMDANIEGKLENGTFEAVVPYIEASTREKGGFIIAEHMTFKDDLWSGEIISKLPPANASAFTIATRQKISENGRIVHIEINIREFTADQNTSYDAQYSTITTYLSEELKEGQGTPGAIIQLASVLPILTTGLVWIAGGLIIGVPLCFVSLGVTMLVRRIIIPLWKRELSKPA